MFATDVIVLALLALFVVASRFVFRKYVRNGAFVLHSYFAYRMLFVLVSLPSVLCFIGIHQFAEPTSIVRVWILGPIHSWSFGLLIFTVGAISLVASVAIFRGLRRYLQHAQFAVADQVRVADVAVDPQRAREGALAALERIATASDPLSALATIVREFLRDAHRLPAHETTGTVISILHERQLSPTWAPILEKLDAARFGHTPASVDDLVRELRAAIG